MRPIKFDLPLNGLKISTLEQLEENLTPEILEPFRSGKLAKWLRARKLDEQAEVVEALLAADNEREVLIFKNLCELFVSAVDENDAREAINDYKTSLPASTNNLTEDMEAVKAEFAKKEIVYQQEIEQLKNPKLKSNETQIGKFIARDDGTALDTVTGLTWCRFAHGQTWLPWENSNGGDVKTVNWNTASDIVKKFNQQGHAGYYDWRLPTIYELETLIDKFKGTDQNHNFIDHDVFPNNNRKEFGSSTTSGNFEKVSYVYFYNGYVGEEYIGNRDFGVRLVR